MAADARDYFANIIVNQNTGAAILNVFGFVIDFIPIAGTAEDVAKVIPKLSRFIIRYADDVPKVMEAVWQVAKRFPHSDDIVLGVARVLPIGAIDDMCDSLKNGCKLIGNDYAKLPDVCKAAGKNSDEVIEATDHERHLLRRVTMKKKCSATTLKLLAIIAMTVDHIALTFVPQESWLHYIMRLFGRLTAPIMAFFIAEGFRHTRSRKKYLLRLSVFGLISQPFYYLLFYGSFSVIGILLHWNVMISLAVALLCLIVMESKLPETPRLILVAICVSLGHFGDWSLMIPVWALIFYIIRKDFRKKAILFAVASIVLQTAIYVKDYDSFRLFTYQYGTLLALIPIRKYSGERGSCRHKKLKRWFFYVYYPTHMAVLFVIRGNAYLKEKSSARFELALLLLCIDMHYKLCYYIIAAT